MCLEGCQPEDPRGGAVAVGGVGAEAGGSATSPGAEPSNAAMITESAIGLIPGVYRAAAGRCNEMGTPLPPVAPVDGQVTGGTG